MEQDTKKTSTKLKWTLADELAYVTRIADHGYAAIGPNDRLQKLRPAERVARYLHGLDYSWSWSPAQRDEIRKHAANCLPRGKRKGK